MGQKVSTSSNPFRNFSLFPLKSSKQPLPPDLLAPPRDFPHLISSCISAASSRTQEYLVFRDPEEKFHPSPQVLTQVFLMTYMAQSFRLQLSDAFSCTVMTPEQRVLLGADWVWAVLEKPTQNPKIQIAVQVLHLPEREKRQEGGAEEVQTESLQMAQRESGRKDACERMVDFCASVGRDCYALFLFFGREDDEENIYGVLSNNLQVSVAKCSRVDRTLLENFFRASKSFQKPSEMMRSVLNNKKREPLTLITQFS